MTHGALFNGIAGFPLAAAWAGIETTWTCEIDEFCNKVSKKHFPNAIQYTDIRAAKHLPYVDIISGGFPCQPFSVAGKQLAQEDDRHLWPETIRIIRESRPAGFIGENVIGIIGLALDEVLADLEAEGYTCETFIVPACALNAPHRRDRVWIVAYSYGQGLQKRIQSRLGSISEAAGALQGSGIARAYPKTDWREFPTESPICGADDGIPARMVRNRAKQIKAYGNAIVPQVAYQFFKAIKKIELSLQINQAA